MKKIIILSLASILFAACQNKDDNSPRFDAGAVTFKTAEKIVEVDSRVTSFDLELEYTRIPDSWIYGTWAGVWLDEEHSTAVDGVHFVNEWFYSFSGNGDKDISHKIEIIPANITEEVVLVYTTHQSYTFVLTENGNTMVIYASPIEDDPDFIGTTVIRLRPKGTAE